MAGVHHPAKVDVAGLQQAHREDRPFQHPADNGEGVTLVASHALVQDPGDGLAGPPDHQQNLVETARRGAGVAQERKPQVEPVGFLPHLDRYPVADPSQVLANGGHRRNHRTGVVDVRQQEGDQLRAALQRPDRLQFLCQSQGPHEQLTLDAGLVGPQVGDRVGRIVEASGRVLSPLQVAAGPQQRLGVAGQDHGVSPNAARPGSIIGASPSAARPDSIMAFRGPAPRCPWIRPPGRSSRSATPSASPLWSARRERPGSAPR